MLQNPTVLHRVQSEVRAVFQNEDEITLRSVSNTSLLPYLEAITQESLRFYPPVPALLPRITGPGGAIIDGNFVPKNVSYIFRTVVPYLSTDIYRSLWAFINGLHTAVAPTSRARIRSTQSVGCQIHRPSTVAMSRLRCNLSPWVQEAVSGRGKSSNRHSQKIMHKANETHLIPLWQSGLFRIPLHPGTHALELRHAA